MARSAGEITIDGSDILRNIRINIRWPRALGLRMWVASRLFQLGGWVSGTNVVVEIEADMTDARKANTLDEASCNPDGTYNGARALSWLSDVLTGGKGMSEGEVREMFADAKAKREIVAPR
ncbi:MAG: hypothetical protein BGN87_18405 [Rhizobiales bacterium 65-79]|nr:hypothetical protein [Hyphomicrobiales bacterium]OJU03576.1 MAG: hypothetical protein BGN87_18405 [Rhizobiales bacterium 65-79]